MSANFGTTASLEIVNRETAVDNLNVDDGTVVHGIALGVDDTTVGQSGVKKKWPAETLKEAAPSLAGTPLVTDHDNGSENVVGQVTKAGYKQDVGVIYEAVVFDEELAQKIQNGLLEVSIRGYHPDPEKMEKDQDGAAIIDKLVFDNLSIVPQGASESNTLEVGEHAELSQSELNDALEELEPVSLASHDSGDESGDGSDNGSPDLSDEDKEIIKSAYNELYDSAKKAQDRAKELGIGKGHHKVTIGDTTFYMPGGDHQEFLDKLRQEVTDTSEENRSDTSEQDDADRKSLYDKICDEQGVENDVLETIADLSEKEIYAEWEDAVNMDEEMMEEWMDHSCSDKASIRPVRVQKRNLGLMQKPRDEWDEVDYTSAQRAVSFISRMRGQRPDDIDDGPAGCPSRWAISLMNWGYTPFDEMPAEPSAEAGLSQHFPDYADINSEDDWEEPNFEDFREPYNLSEDQSFESLDTEMKSAIAEHFIYAEGGLPPENYGDLKFPVVSPDGTLYLDALRSVKQTLHLADVSEEDADKIREIANDLAKREFGKDWKTGQSIEQSVDISQDALQAIQAEAHSVPTRAKSHISQFKEVYRRGIKSYDMVDDEVTQGKDAEEWAIERVREYANLLEAGLPADERYSEDNNLLPSNHPRSEPIDDTQLTEVSPAGFRGVELEPTVMTEATVAKLQGDNTMTDTTDERVEELEAQVEELESRNDELLDEIEQVRAEYAATLADEGPFTKDELVDKFTVEELREKYDENEAVQLAEGGPAPQAGDAEEAELSDDSDDVDEEYIATLESRIENYEEMGWDAAAETARSELKEMRN